MLITTMKTGKRVETLNRLTLKINVVENVVEKNFLSRIVRIPSNLV